MATPLALEALGGENCSREPLCSGSSLPTGAEASRGQRQGRVGHTAGKSKVDPFSGVSGLELCTWDTLNALCFITRQAGAKGTI